MAKFNILFKGEKTQVSKDNKYKPIGQILKQKIAKFPGIKINGRLFPNLSVSTSFPPKLKMADMHMLFCQNEMIKFIVKITGKNQQPRKVDQMSH